MVCTSPVKYARAREMLARGRRTPKWKWKVYARTIHESACTRRAYGVRHDTNKSLKFNVSPPQTLPAAASVSPQSGGGFCVMPSVSVYMCVQNVCARVRDRSRPCRRRQLAATNYLLSTWRTCAQTRFGQSARVRGVPFCASGMVKMELGACSH